MNSNTSVILLLRPGASTALLTLRSMARQSAPADELIIVGPEERIESFRSIRNDLQLSGRIDYLIQAPSGYATSANLGIQDSNSEYCLVLEEGTILEPNAIQYLSLALKNNPSAYLAYSAYRTFNYFGNPESASCRIVPGSIRTSGPFDRNKLIWRNFFPRESLYRRLMFAQGLRFSENVFWPEWDLALKIHSRGSSFEYQSFPLILRPKSNSLSELASENSQLVALANVVRANPSLYHQAVVAWAKELTNSYRNVASGQRVIAYSTELSGISDVPPNHPLRATLEALLSQGAAITFVTKGSHGPRFQRGMQRIDVNNFSDGSFQSYLDRLGGPLTLVGHGQSAPLILSRAKPLVTSRLYCVDSSGPFYKVSVPDAVDLVVATSADALEKLCFSSNAILVSEGAPRGTVSKLGHPLSSGLKLEEQIETSTSAELLTNAPFAVRLRTEVNKLSDFSIKREAIRSQRLSKLKEHNYQSRSGPKIDLSVIICCRNVDAVRLRRSILSLKSQTIAAREIVISDYGSSEQFSEQLRSLSSELDCVLVRTEAGGPWNRSAALNCGIRQASSSWIMTTDADMIFCDTFFSMLSSYIDELGAQSIFYAQPIKLPPLNIPNDWKASMFEQLQARGRMYGEQGRGGCQVVTAKWLKQVRGFNEKYVVWGNEDDDIFDRATWSGLRPTWLEPGRYLHQWHMPNIYQSARKENHQEYTNLRLNPRLVVNGENWGSGTASSEYIPPDVLINSTEEPKRPISEIQREIIELENQPQLQAEKLLHYAAVALNFKQTDGALELLEDSIHLEPNNVLAYLMLAEVFIQMNLIEYAVVNVDRALQVEPNNEQALAVRESLRPL